MVQVLSDSDGALKSDIFNCKTVNTMNPISEGMDFEEFAELLKESQDKTSIDAVYTAILKSPILGSMKYQEECFWKEGQLVRNAVIKLIKRFSELYGQQCPLLAFDPKLRGSAAEDTKCGPPDEFDFMLTMNKLSTHCLLSVIDNCKAYVILEVPEIPELLQLPPHKMIQSLHIWLMAMSSGIDDIRQVHPYLIEDGILQFTEDIHPHAFRMGGISFEVLSIDWPIPVDFSNCQLYGLFRNACWGFDLSSTDYEEVLLKSLPSAAIDAYVLGKAFASTHFKWRGKHLSKIFGISYKLKKAILLYLRQHKDPQSISRHDWIKGTASVAANMEKYIKDMDCRRCIFHAEKWTCGENECLNLSF
ncbi:hypothetical protein CAPTEDRAFT_212676 [Capitella teleta]|uniref:Mab-21-like HhH/H2TH-like domain-containing protein n=1 Tax=Capitella teleta TaxID=283909 RepID=R7TKK7_CAPTE|nr:hypothetical protein CAPTEDRAFT_212676 [Capitella teleta]|eukprot:ELT94239.1 hypothetical protein CAPTEDRAFT_212676 [Capitella teleta]